MNKIYYRLGIVFLIFTHISCSKTELVKTNCLMPSTSQLVFSIKEIGKSGEHTELFKLIKSHQAENNAENLFLNLTFSIDPVIQLYGLYGLKLVGSTLYQVQKKSLLLNANKSVLYNSLGGCEVHIQTVEAVISIIDNF